MEERRCKRCLLRELAGQVKVYETVRRYIEDLEPERRADQAASEARLEKCKACDRLSDGMCRACGCYVELRAAMKEQECPYERW